MESAQSNGKLSLIQKLSYGVGDLGANLVFNMVSFYLLYYLTDVALLTASLAGLVLTLVRVIDAFTDPAIGMLSDRTQSRWGRRRPFILFGAIPVGVFFFLLFAGTPLRGQTGMFLYFLLIYAVFFISYSVVNVPYSALTPDLTKDPDERTVLNGYRMACAIIGTLVAAGATSALVGLFPDESTGFAMVAAAYGLIFILMSQIVFWGSKGRDRSVPQTGSQKVLGLYLSALKNKPFMLVAVTYIIHSFAVTTISSSLIYYLKYYIGREGLISTIFLVLLLTAMLFIPLWVWISKKIGKKQAYMIGMSVLACAMVVMFLLKPEQVPFIYVLAFAAGSGLSTFFVLPWAIVPDTIDYHAQRTGQQIEGVFYGIWNFGPKLGSAVAGFCLGMGLTAFGYVPNLVTQSSKTILGIRSIFCLVPAVIILCGVVVMSFYRLNQKSPAGSN